MKLIKFKQINCKPCKELDMFLSLALGVKVDEEYVLDGDDTSHVDKAIEFGVMSTPVLVLVDDEGNEVGRVNGVSDKEAIIELVGKRGR